MKAEPIFDSRGRLVAVTFTVPVVGSSVLAPIPSNARSIPHDSLKKFVDAWRSGALGLPFGPARTTDVHRAYAEWAANNNVRPVNARDFGGHVEKLVEGYRLVSRYRCGDGRWRQARTLMPGGVCPPSGLDRVAWISDGVRAFAGAIGNAV